MLKDELTLVQDKITKFQKAHGLIDENVENLQKKLKSNSSVVSTFSDSPLSSLSNVESPGFSNSHSMETRFSPDKDKSSNCYTASGKNEHHLSSDSDTEVSIC